MAAAALAHPNPVADPRLIVPLDVPTAEEARALVAALDEAVSFYKVGLELLATDGMVLARELKAEGKQVFLDWKLHDIGTTVQRAAAVLAQSGCDFLTVHGEPQVMAAAVRGRGGSGLKILAVTVLTSLDDADLSEMGYAETARALVERRIHQAIAAGCDGVVASPQEAALARSLAAGISWSSPRACGRTGRRRTTRRARRRRWRLCGRAPRTSSAAGRSPPPTTRGRPPCASPRKWPGSRAFPG